MKNKNLTNNYFENVEQLKHIESVETYEWEKEEIKEIEDMNKFVDWDKTKLLSFKWKKWQYKAIFNK